MPRPHRLPPVALDLVEVYLAEFTQAGFRAVRSAEDGARGFCARFGSPEGWTTAPLQAQVGADERVRRFVAWLALTARMPVSADYLTARRPRLGPIMAAYHPAVSLVFAESATALGFVAKSSERQWAALAQVCALHAVAPDAVTHALLDTSHAALDAAAERLGVAPHPNRRAILFGLQATLFHAGLSDEPPRPRTHRATPRRDRWEDVPTVLAQTLTGYLDQLRVTRRPGTVANEDEALREFACFLARHHPDVRSAAQVTRAHVEAYKHWLIERPARRGGRLHRQTVRRRLNSVQLCFQRLIEWGASDAPARAPIFPADLPLKDQPLPRFLDDAAAAKLLRRRPRRSRPAGPAHRRVPRPHRRAQERTARRSPSTRSCRSAPPTGCGSRSASSTTTATSRLHPQLKTAPRRLARQPARGPTHPVDCSSNAGGRCHRARGRHGANRSPATPDSGTSPPHRLRHTLATQAINRGMSLDAIAALLGHRPLRMTMIYANPRELHQTGDLPALGLLSGGGRNGSCWPGDSCCLTSISSRPLPLDA